MMEEANSFEYSYSAPEQEEIRRIREKYLPPEERETKMEQLRRLDASVTQKGTMYSILLGVVSTLVMGIGMSCCMVWGGTVFLPGIVIGILGMVGVALAYPLFVHLVKKERERLAPQILKLTEELLQ